jgi:hypothetical protein
VFALFRTFIADEMSPIQGALHVLKAGAVKEFCNLIFLSSYDSFWVALLYTIIGYRTQTVNKLPKNVKILSDNDSNS